MVMVDYKIDAVKLQTGLLKHWREQIGSSISREEYDLLSLSLVTCNNVGFIRFFSYCENSDFTLATYENLRKKIIAIYPTLQLDKKIRFFDRASYVLKTQARIDKIIAGRYAKPTPLNEICSSKDLTMMWFQHGANGKVAVMRMPIVSTFAINFGKSILGKDKGDSFRWSKNSHGYLDGCSIDIKTVDSLLYFLGDLIDSESKNTQENIAKLKKAMVAANALDADAGLHIFFKTKAPAKDTQEKAKRGKWVKPEPKHYTLSDLKKRKWTTRLIDKYLDEPDTYFENTRNRFVPTHGYDIARVAKIEKTSAFKADFQLNRPRKNLV